jgi:hypothetical protein
MTQIHTENCNGHKLNNIKSLMESSMPRPNSSSLMAIALVLVASSLGAQGMRRQGPEGQGGAAPVGIPRDARFPYAGVWTGSRTMPVGTGEIGFRFTVSDGKYSGTTLHPDGSTAPQDKLALTAAGLTWESPNSGGGTWVYNVRLAGPDSMVGTLVLRDAPANFTTVPKGTMVLTRQAPARSK